jgi:hypothetical protein
MDGQSPPDIPRSVQCSNLDLIADHLLSAKQRVLHCKPMVSRKIVLRLLYFQATLMRGHIAFHLLGSFGHEKAMD